MGTVKLFLVAVIVIFIGMGFWYVTNLKADLAIAKENSKKLEAAVGQQQAVIDKAYQDIEEIRSINGALKDEAERQAAELKALNDKFSVNAKGEKRDFGAIAKEKPKAIQRLINRGTDNVIRCLQIASGAELTEKEINAKTASEANPECPTLANPNYKPLIK
jgi:hypothetical protein